MSLLNKAAAFARSPKGRQLVEQAKQYAAKPENRQKLEAMRTKMARRGSGGPRPS